MIIVKFTTNVYNNERDQFEMLLRVCIDGQYYGSVHIMHWEKKHKPLSTRINIFVEKIYPQQHYHKYNTQEYMQQFHLIVKYYSDISL